MMVHPDFVVSGFPVLTDGDGQNDDPAPGNQLLAEFEARQNEPIVDEADHEGSHDGSDNCTLPAKQACSA